MSYLRRFTIISAILTLESVDLNSLLLVQQFLRFFSQEFRLLPIDFLPTIFPCRIICLSWYLPHAYIASILKLSVLLFQSIFDSSAFVSFNPRLLTFPIFSCQSLSMSKPLFRITILIVLYTVSHHCLS